MDTRMSEWTHVRMHCWRQGWTHGRTDPCADGTMSRCMDNALTDPLLELLVAAKYELALVGSNILSLALFHGQ